MVETKLNIKDFIVLDIENPNTKADSICSIAFIQVKNNEVVKKENVLINPEDRFDEINMRVNKITPNMVKDSLTFDKFWKDNEEILTNSIIVGHGIEYDLSVITKTLQKYNIILPTLKIICTQKLSQKYLDISHYKLDYVCDYLGIKLEEHHNALFDTMACLDIFNYIKDNYDIDENDVEEYNYIENKNRSTGMKVVYSDDTKSLQVLKSIIETIMEDQKIELEEIYSLNSWLNDNTQLIGNYPFDKINNIVKSVLLDGKVSDEEYIELISIFNEFINPLEENKNDSDIIFENMNFCLTGTFNSGSKEEVENKIVNKGGIISKGVNSKLNYLIVGGSGSEAWKFGNYGGKVQKAMELNEKGKSIQIIGEDDLLKYLN